MRVCVRRSGASCREDGGESQGRPPPPPKPPPSAAAPDLHPAVVPIPFIGDSGCTWCLGVGSGAVIAANHGGAPVNVRCYQVIVSVPRRRDCRRVDGVTADKSPVMVDCI
ncbi:unnamed protein product [Urochloa humidicola]